MIPQHDASGARSRELIENMVVNPMYGKAPEDLLEGAAHAASQQGWIFNWEAGLTFWWDLCRIGAVAIVGGGSGGIYNSRPRLIVTQRGRQLLERKDGSPHNGSRYLAAVRQRVREADAIAMAYLEEAIGAWQAGLSRSSVITLGCACERLIVLLAHAVREVALIPYSEKLGKMFASQRPVGISEIFEQVQAALSQAAGLPTDLDEAVRRSLVPIFEHARTLRNQHGHPTGATVTSEDAEAGLLLFPGFYSLVSRLIGHLKSLPVNAEKS